MLVVGNVWLLLSVDDSFSWSTSLLLLAIVADVLVVLSRYLFRRRCKSARWCGE